MQQPQQRGLARAVGAHEHEPVAPVQGQRGLVQRDQRAEAHRRALEPDQRHRAHRGRRLRGERAAHRARLRRRGSAQRARGQPLQQPDGAVDRTDHRQQHDAQRQGQREVALAGLQRDGGGHHARDAGDVAADDHHRPHLGDGPREGREQHGGHAHPVVHQHQQGGGQRPGAQRAQLVAAVGQRRHHEPARQRGDQRRDEHALRHHHRRRREKNAQFAQRPRAREQQVHQQAHDHGGQGEQRVHQPHGQRMPRKPRHRQPGAQQQAEQRADQAGRGAHLQRQRRDAHEFGVGAGDEAPGQRPAFGHGVHRGTAFIATARRCSSRGPARPSTGAPFTGPRSGRRAVRRRSCTRRWRPARRATRPSRRSLAPGLSSRAGAWLGSRRSRRTD
ncbi:hypothetical protein D9M68_431910 [compost metagenome]